MPQYESFASRNKPNYRVPIGTNNCKIPVSLKTQLILIIFEFCKQLNNFRFRSVVSDETEILSRKIVNEMRKVVRELNLSGGLTFDSYQLELLNFLENNDNFYYLMSAYEYFCNYIHEMSEIHPDEHGYDVPLDILKNTIDDTINEINFRFKENGVGYQYNRDGGQFISINSELVNQHATTPTLKSLTQPRFSTALKELKDAYKNLQSNDHPDALVCANRSYESVMKIIYHGRGWDYPEDGTAKKLIKVAFDKELIPKSAEHFTNSLMGVLESSVPTFRNKYGGHGHGVKPKEIPEHLVRFVLNMTTSLIHYLIESDHNFDKKS